MKVTFAVKDSVHFGLGRSLVEQSLELSGLIHFLHRDRAGNVKREFTIKNLITSAGKAEVAGLLSGDTSGVFSYIALGTGATAANVSDTALQAEISTNGGSRASATVSRVTTTVTNDTAQLYKLFTFTGSLAITESGVLDAASTGVLLCRQVFSAINVVNTDTLAVTWKIAVS